MSTSRFLQRFKQLLNTSGRVLAHNKPPSQQASTLAPAITPSHTQPYHHFPRVQQQAQNKADPLEKYKKSLTDIEKIVKEHKHHIANPSLRKLILNIESLSERPGKKELLVETYTCLGESLSFGTIKEGEEALEALEGALKLNPTYKPALHLKEELRYSLGLEETLPPPSPNT